LFKALLFALLAVDTGWFVWSGATSKAIDAAAWLTLLALFDIETHLAAQTRRPTVDVALGAARLAAAAGVMLATLRYVFEDNVLDAVNSVLWIGVVVLLETQVRFPGLAARARTIFGTVAALLYGGLAVLVVAWGLRGEWFDAYDALLWLIAFAALELTLFSAKGASASVTPRYTPAEKP
jgi:hypothetical protein